MSDYVFEGSEKRLQLDFTKSSKLRSIPKEKWDVILKFAQCEIISHKSTHTFDAYVLSESSLFVYDDQIILKTCGTTSLLLALQSILDEAKKYNGQFCAVQFSRAHFLFPLQQPSVHQSFANEVKFLLKKFPNGHAHILGPLNGPRIHVFMAESLPKPTINQQRLEVLMFDLPTNVMNMFYKKLENDNTANNDQRPNNGKEATSLAGFEKLLPGALIDDFLFDPCGYSCNGLLDESYFTIHITPQEEFSFVSFETNSINHSYDELILKIRRIFRPNNMTISLHYNEKTMNDEQYIWDIDRYVSKGRTTNQFSNDLTISCGHYVADHDLVKRQSSPKVFVENDIDDLCQSKHGNPYNVTRKLTRIQIETLCKQIINVETVETDWDHRNVLREIIDSYNNLNDTIDDDSLIVANLDELISRFDRWTSHFPNIQPYFSVSNLPNNELITVLNGLGVGFIANDVSDVELLKHENIMPKKIILGGMLKSLSCAVNAHDFGIERITFFNEIELKRLAKSLPNAELFLHVSHRPTDAIISSNDDTNQIHGATMFEAKELLKLSKQLNVNIIGIHMSLGDEHSGQLKYLRIALNRVRSLVEYAKELNMELNIINLGDSFWDETKMYNDKCLSLERFAKYVNKELATFPETVRFIAEPSKFFVSSMLTIVMPIVRKRIAKVDNNNNEEHYGAIYYVSEGVHTVLSTWLDKSNVPIEFIKDTSNQQQHIASYYGPSCLKNDILVKNKLLPNMEVGDYVFVRNVGIFNNSSVSGRLKSYSPRMLFFMHSDESSDEDEHTS